LAKKACRNHREEGIVREKILFSASPSGFSDHQRRHLFGFNVLHIGFDAASATGEYADDGLDPHPGMLDRKPFMKPFSNHYFQTCTPVN
jgi:hypothetical protein